jgi:hypothetical protein
MKLIKPAEISAKIMTLIDEAKEKIIIVSPYNSIIGWTKLTNRIKKAQANGIKINWYTRGNNVSASNSEEIRFLNINPILIDDLHAKVYFNEKYAIFTSMNMCKASDDKSIDFGYITETSLEYKDLFSAFETHIVNSTLRYKQDFELKQPEKITNEILLNEYYFQVIHNRINRKYGLFELNYQKGEMLEYFDFIKTKYTLQVIAYSQAIKINIFFPEQMTEDQIRYYYESRIANFEADKLSELQLCHDKLGNYIKYYFEKPYKKLKTWDINLLHEFLKDLDVLVRTYLS